MHDFETAGFADPSGGEMALVAGFAFEVGRFERDVADFEDFDGQVVMFVLAERFQQPR